MWQTFGSCQGYTDVGDYLGFSLNVPLNEEWEILRLRTISFYLVPAIITLSVNRDRRINVIPSESDNKLTIGDKIKGGSNISLYISKFNANVTSFGYYIDVIRKGISS